MGPTRIRVFFRIEPKVPGGEKLALKVIYDHMHKFIKKNLDLYQKKGMTMWCENSATDGEFDDVTKVTCVINAALKHLKLGDWVEMRPVKTEFLHQLRAAVREAGARGYCG